MEQVVPSSHFMAVKVGGKKFYLSASRTKKAIIDACASGLINHHPCPYRRVREARSSTTESTLSNVWFRVTDKRTHPVSLQ
ncbi:hypothetical protein AMATHDRAFT_66272 [Amanita thiersii Skay4041]|uniref:Uncharacterized protein n=1 Tax=Amanita thiersii Skay4041 TaxID=703135 RepID=A0A2A9NK72_9AGAR|nr:hypothetical protein AMATHDRAFT_66272 [Amanita thiersii Skay4041]